MWQTLTRVVLAGFLSFATILPAWAEGTVARAQFSFDIGGDRWRVWSSKRLMPGFDGKWSVDIVLDGNIVETHSFDYVDEY